MIPNCEGCECELAEAYELQSKGCKVILEGIGERRHLFLKVLNDKGKIVLE
jgi:hypothetical protein